MPTTFRLLATLAIIVGLIWGAMFALATFVKPRVGEISVQIPADRLQPRQQE